MPINFSDLVAKVEAQNQQNRQQLVAQVMPAIDLMVKRREYDYENEQAASNLATLAQQNEIPFAPIAGADQNTNTLAFNMAAGRKATADKKAEELAKKQETENSIRETLLAEAEVNSDFAPILAAVKDKPLVVQQAAYKKYLSDSGRADEWEDWKRKANYSAAIAMQKSDNIAGNKPPKTATPTQINTVTNKVETLNQEATLFATQGKQYGTGDKKLTVMAGKDSNGTLTVTLRDKGGKAISYNGKTFSGKKITSEEKKALRSAMADLKVLKMKQSTAVDAYNRVVGIEQQPAPQTQAAPASDKAVKSLVDKY